MSKKTLTWRVFGVWALVVTVLAGVLAIPPSHTVFATPAQPATDWSFYIETLDTGTASTLGCNQGKFDQSVYPYRNSEVVLDFGDERDSSGDTILTFDNLPATVSEIESVTTSFAEAYWSCTGNDGTSLLKLGVGTNNSGYTPTYTTGVAWANIVAAIRSTVQSRGWSSQVDVFGANDIEPDWSAWSDTNAWIQGYSSVDPAHYLDYGSADGCSTSSDDPNRPCNNGWTMDNVWEASWGAAPALAIPEIYNTAQPLQWTQIALDGAQHHGGAVYYEGPWDEHDLNSSTNTSAQAWSLFWNDLNSYSSIAQTPIFSAEIHMESCPQTGC